MNHAAAHANPPASARSAPVGAGVAFGSVWRGWLLVFAAFWASFAPAWAAAFPANDPFAGAPAPGSSAWSTVRQYKTATRYSAEYKPEYQAAAQANAPSRAGARVENSRLGFFAENALFCVPRASANNETASGSEVADAETASGRIVGLYYLRARFMNPDSGRFWNQDTYEGSNSDPASLHKYNYGSSNPVRFMDPSGHMTAELAIGNVVRGLLFTMAVVTAAVIIQRETPALILSFSSPFASSRTKSKAEEERDRRRPYNQMRLQLQTGSTNIWSTDELFNTAAMGVTVRQVQTALMALYIFGETLIPRAAEHALSTAVVRFSEKLNHYPPLGTVTIGNVDRQSFTSDGTSYRIDLENLKGHNLRNF